MHPSQPEQFSPTATYRQALLAKNSKLPDTYSPQPNVAKNRFSILRSPLQKKPLPWTIPKTQNWNLPGCQKDKKMTKRIFWFFFWRKRLRFPSAPCSMLGVANVKKISTLSRRPKKKDFFGLVMKWVCPRPKKNICTPGYRSSFVLLRFFMFVKIERCLSLSTLNLIFPKTPALLCRIRRNIQQGNLGSFSLKTFWGFENQNPTRLHTQNLRIDLKLRKA